MGALFEILVPLHIGAVGYHLHTHKVNPLPRMATEGMVNAGSAVVDAAKHRPAALVGATLIIIPAGPSSPRAPSTIISRPQPPP